MSKRKRLISINEKNYNRLRKRDERMAKDDVFRNFNNTMTFSLNNYDLSCSNKESDTDIGQDSAWPEETNSEISSETDGSSLVDNYESNRVGNLSSSNYSRSKHEHEEIPEAINKETTKRVKDEVDEEIDIEVGEDIDYGLSKILKWMILKSKRNVSIL